MRIWIDATGADRALCVFGMSPLERLLRTLLASGAHISEVRVALPDGEPAPSCLPTPLASGLPLRWSPQCSEIPFRSGTGWHQSSSDHL